MKTWKKLAFSLGVALAGLGVAEQATFAFEPVDNNSPIASLEINLNATVLECGVNPGCQFPSDSIATSTDNDYFMVVCGSGRVTSISITMPSAGPGHDLDIKVYKANNPNFIGISQGVGTTETVSTTAFNLNAYVLQVYGFGGSTNTYAVTANCSNL